MADVGWELIIALVGTLFVAFGAFWLARATSGPKGRHRA